MTRVLSGQDRKVLDPDAGATRWRTAARSPSARHGQCRRRGDGSGVLRLATRSIDSNGMALLMTFFSASVRACRGFICKEMLMERRSATMRFVNLSGGRDSRQHARCGGALRNRLATADVAGSGRGAEHQCVENVEAAARCLGGPSGTDFRIHVRSGVHAAVGRALRRRAGDAGYSHAGPVGLRRDVLRDRRPRWHGVAMAAGVRAMHAPKLTLASVIEASLLDIDVSSSKRFAVRGFDGVPCARWRVSQPSGAIAGIAPLCSIRAKNAVRAAAGLVGTRPAVRQGLPKHCVLYVSLWEQVFLSSRIR